MAAKKEQVELEVEYVDEEVPAVRGQAVYDAARRSRKAAAAATMAANAKAAERAKRKALAKAPSNSETAAFNTRAKAIEARINKPVTTGEDSSK